MVIAIDGPAGAGKSTIAKKTAGSLNAIYIDTGAMYRAVGLYVLRNNISPDDKDEIIKSLDNINITIQYFEGTQQIFLNNENVNTLIRTREIGDVASKVSAIREVREKLVDLQRKIAADNDVVMDGRDIGTVVLPNANLKIYLTASTKERARRRFLELSNKGETADVEVIEKEIIERDYRDMHREVSPLVKADDAIEVDSSDMTIDEVCERIILLLGK